MPKFSTKSLSRKAEVHERLKEILDEAIAVFDFSIVCGHRGEAEQNAAYKGGFSQKKWPDSKHNSTPSLAVDVVPYPPPSDIRITPETASPEEAIDALHEHGKWYFLAGVIRGIAQAKGIRIRQGCNWDGDSDFSDQKFDDLPHFELILDEQ